VRFEDTDKERSKEEYEQSIIDGLHWLDLSWDEEFKQSERTQIYKKYIEKLIESGDAYISKEEAREEGQRSEVIRFKNPNKVITFTDMVRGEISFDTTDLGDFVIAKSLEDPLYHLAVVVDDMTMNISHVIRGDDHISNTPRQIAIIEALGGEIPKYSHLPLLLGADRSKLSKRHGAKAVTGYKEDGYLPEAFINYLVFLGWNPGDDREVMSINELIESFDMSGVQKGGAIFSQEKLDWYNKEYIKLMDDIDLIPKTKEVFKDIDDQDVIKLIPYIKERITTLNDIQNLKEEEEFEFIFSAPSINADKLAWKDEPVSTSIDNLVKLVELIEKSEENIFKTPESVKELIWPLAEEVGRGNLLQPLRFGLSGRERSIDPFSIIYLIGKEETLARLKKIINHD
jgi:glutamyl-tRNA synthetase